MKKKLIGILISILMIVLMMPTGIPLKSDHGNSHKTAVMMLPAENNSAPIFGACTPANGSVDTLLNLTWSILINDPEGDVFNWSIHCNNGQTNSGVNATNGTKTLLVTNITALTKYTIWVNATDPGGSGKYTRAWYVFTTKASNQPPFFGTSSPVNGSTNNALNLTWSIPIYDPNGDHFNWKIYCNNGQINSGINETNGTKILHLTNLTVSTKYTIWVNATDPLGTGNYSRAWYIFTTKEINQPPIFGIPSPANGSTNIALNLTWNIPINDPNGDHFNWSIQCNNKQTSKGTNAVNGTKTLQLTNLTFQTKYTIWVNATDSTGSGKYTRVKYFFTTRSESKPILTIIATPNILWPPNHKMIDVVITGAVKGTGVVTFTVEDEYHLFEPTLNGFNQTIHLQSWRSGSDRDGRVYTITASITDGQGYVTSASTIVLVPHDQGH